MPPTAAKRKAVPPRGLPRPGAMPQIRGAGRGGRGGVPAPGTPLALMPLPAAAAAGVSRVLERRRSEPEPSDAIEADDDYGSDEEPPPAKRRRKHGNDAKAINCRRQRCARTSDIFHWAAYDVTVNPDGTVIAKPSGDVCEDCMKTYLQCGFELIGTLDEVLEKCNANVDVDNGFILAERRRTGATPMTHVQSEVNKGLSTGVRALVRMKGLTPSEFEIRFGITHVIAKRKLQDLLHPVTGTGFKGILLMDDGSMTHLGITYEFWKEISVQKRDIHLPWEQHFMEEHAKNLFDDLTLPSKDEDPEVTLYRSILCFL